MEYLYLLSSSTIIATSIVTLTHVYFYVIYHERYMGYWVASWLIFFARLVLFDYGGFDWKQSVIGFTVYEVLFLGCAILFLRGVHSFVEEPLNKWWIIGSSASLIFGAALTFLPVPLALRIAPSAIFGGVILVQIGRMFTRDLRMKGIGHLINGYSFILWGYLTIAMPYTISVTWLSPWCYLAGGFLRLVIACGTLLVYFEKTRSDLVDKENLYRLLAENALDMIYRYRLVPKAEFEYVSPAVYVITGYPPEAFYRDCTLLEKSADPNDLPLLSNFIKNPDLVLRSPLTFRIIRKDQAKIWVEQTCVPIKDKNGRIIALEGILRDITSRKNMEQLVSKVDKLNTVGQMAASVAHEIRNPLTSVRGYLQLMQKKQEGCSTDRDRYSLMISELDRTNAIISEYLMLAQDKVPNLSVCSLNNLIRMVYPLLQAKAVATNMNIALCLGNIPELYLDEYEIRQLLFNLVNNGLDAMQKGGELVITTYVELDKVILSIADQGPGIPVHVLDNLGTPFLTTKDTGTGLGLPVCYRIANRHSATIRIDTGSLGTTFFIEFSNLRNAS